MQDIFTVEEVAKVLRCNPRTVLNAIKDKQLKAAKVGKGYRISRTDLEAWFQALGGSQLFGDERDETP